MKQLLILILITLNFSCSEKAVQLPETTNKDITEVLDVSPVYMFYNEETDSIEFNRKNMISSTNWLVNIDKRLTLKQILPHLQYLQEKRHGDGMHKNENARNYFTCNNTDLKNLSFIEFTEERFVDSITIRDVVIKQSDFPKENTLISIFFNSKNEVIIFINNEKPSIINLTLNNFEHTMDSLIDSNSFKKYVHMEFKESLTFQNYITFKTKLRNLDNTNLDISNVQFVHN